MPRKKVSRSLVRLPSRSKLSAADHKTERLLEILRDVAIRNQQLQPQAFYSIREVAGRFGLAPSSVSHVYGQLEQEGILSRIRGSKTVLQGLTYDRQLRVRAFVGLPASLSAFVTTQDYRMFFLRARRELRRRGFATATVFFEGQEVRTEEFTDRLMQYEVDSVIWFLPRKSAMRALLQLKDIGIRVLGVTADRYPPIPCRYEVSRDTAISRLLNNGGF